MAKRAKARAAEALAAARDQVDRAGRALAQAETLVAAIAEGAEPPRAKATLRPPVASFAAWLRLKLTEEGIGEKELAERARIPYGTLHSWVWASEDSKGPPLLSAMRLLIALDVDFDEFLRIEAIQSNLAALEGFEDWKAKRFKS